MFLSVDPSSGLAIDDDRRRLRARSHRLVALIAQSPVDQ